MCLWGDACSQGIFCPPHKEGRGRAKGGGGEEELHEDKSVWD